MKETKMNPILGDLFGAVVFWLSGAVLKDSIAAAIDAVGGFTSKYAARASLWLRRDLVAKLKPVFWLYAGFELAALIFANVWIDRLSVTTASDAYWYFEGAAWTVFGLSVLAMVAGTWGVQAVSDWPALIRLVNDGERFDRLIGDIATTLRLNRLSDELRDYLRSERDTLVDQREELPVNDARRDPFNSQIADIDLILAFYGSPEDRTKYAVDRLTRAMQGTATPFSSLDPGTRQRSIDAELVRLSGMEDAVRQLVIDERATLQAEIRRVDAEIDALRADSGRGATGFDAFAVVAFLVAPFFLAFLVLGSSLCLSMLNGADLVMLFPIGASAFVLFAMGVAALKLVTGLFAKVLEIADTVFDKTLDALIKPLLAAGLVGTTFSNVGDKFGKVDLPIKEVGEAVKKATTPIIDIGWSLFIWCVLIPHWYSFILVFLSAVFNYYIARRRESVGLGDEAKTHLKNVIRLEQKVLTPIYIFWLVMIGFYIACTFDFARARLNYAIGWINDLLSLGGWGIVGSILFGIVLLIVAGTMSKEGVSGFFGRALRVLGTAGIILPLFGLAAWMAGRTAHVPTVDELSPRSRPASSETAEEDAAEAEGEEPDAFDRAESAAGRSGPSTGHPEDALLGGHDATALTATTVAVIPVIPAGSVGLLGDTGGRSDVPPFPGAGTDRSALARTDPPRHSTSGARDCSGLVPTLRAALEARGECR
ncbi:phage holin family protein [Candidatus Uhrbacteria bacterium]|nr:phage holin family protein [Candidatus Uhrbacteria bacterium]